MKPLNALPLVAIFLFAIARAEDRATDSNSRADVRARVDLTPKAFADPSARLPHALRGRALDRLSSGALIMLDRDGDLVRWPASARREETVQAAAASATIEAGLDARVRSNIRLGDDPPVLP